MILCVGLDVLGMPLTEQFVHRPERMIAVAGGPIGEPITASLVAIVLAHEEGGQKGVPVGARV